MSPKHDARLPLAFIPPGTEVRLAGFGVVVKLGLLALAAIHPEMALAMFWIILVLSTLLSHAPGGIRHYRLF